MKKITSVNGFVFLFNDVPHKQRNKLGIASGESILLSIYENDTFFFSSDVNLIKYKNIINEEAPTPLEIDFFNMVKEAKEVKYKKSLVEEYGITKYVHFLPKVSFKQEILSENELEVTGIIRYPESIHENDVPVISIDQTVLSVDDESRFKYILSPIPSKGGKITFTLDLPKQIITRSYKIK
ncbi:hypothetical protein [Enterococcus malodoratus]|uniref:hypothetical protein n=1 Tax=Enterococcus malodoratus TaxID=71451 RepID=UPI0039B004CB